MKSNSKYFFSRPYLFFDTETTGLPKNWKAPVTDLNNWPRLVQLAYLFYDKNRNKISGGDYIIKPEGFTIPADASRIHGISTERAIREGKSLLTVLQDFQYIINQADYLVAHNMSFDEKIVGAEFLRNRMPDSTSTKRKICTTKARQTFAPLTDLMVISGQSFLSCITNCFGQILKKRIMLLWTSMLLQNAFGNLNDLVKYKYIVRRTLIASLLN